MEPQTSAASSGYASKGTHSPKSTYETPRIPGYLCRKILPSKSLWNDYLSRHQVTPSLPRYRLVREYY